MKRLLTVLVFAAASVPASAADMPVKAAPLPAAMGYNWTGFYDGGHVGYGWAKSDILNLNGGASFPAGTTSTNHYAGVIGGGQFGYNYQFNHNWVVGIEGDFSWSDMSGSTFAVSPITAATLDTQNKISWIATAAGRVGYTFSNWLLYAKGGGAWAHFDGTAVGASAAGAIGYRALGNETRSGWLVGGGLEYGWSNWSAKVEYNYLDFGTETVSRFATFNVIGNPNPALRASDSQAHLVKVGLNYRFGWPSLR